METFSIGWIDILLIYEQVNSITGSSNYLTLKENILFDVSFTVLFEAM